ncbi:MAG: hypothetical protein AAFR61_21215 [Bacteroidota bacterium]
MAKFNLSSTSSLAQGNLHYYHLPKGMVHIEITRIGNGENAALQMTAPTVEVVADPAARYFLHYTPNAFTNDDITLEFNEAGFLSRVHTLVEDQSGAVFDKLIELGSAVAEVALPVPKTRDVGDAGPVTIFSGKIDPFHAESMEDLNTALARIHESCSLKVVDLAGEDAPASTSSKSAQNGIYCRPMGTFSFQLSSPKGTVFHQVRLPHPEQVHFIGFPKGDWVKTEFEVTFDAVGYPNRISLKNPSTALAIISAPINLIKAILELPAKLFQFRLNLDSSQNQAMMRQMELSQEYENLRKQQEMAALASAEGPEGAVGTRGLFSNWFNKGGGSKTSASSGNAGGGGGTADSAEVAALKDTVQKLQQDLDIMRKRMNNV